MIQHIQSQVLSVALAACGAVAVDPQPPLPPQGMTCSPVAIGDVSTVAGDGVRGGYVDGPAPTAEFGITQSTVVAASGDIFFGDLYNHAIRKLSDATVSTVAGGTEGFLDGIGKDARFAAPFGMRVDVDGSVLVADSSAPMFHIRRVSPGGVVTTVATFPGPVVDLLLDGQGRMLVSSLTQVWSLENGNLSVYAGSTTPGNANGERLVASFRLLQGIVRDSRGNVYLSDGDDQRIRKIDTAGMVSTFAGNGSVGATDGPGPQASFYTPGALTTDASDNIYVMDSNNSLVRRISPDGIVSTIAGRAGLGYVDGPSAVAEFRRPGGMALEPSGDLIVTDEYNGRVRRVSTSGTGKLVVSWPTVQATPAVTSYTATATAPNRPAKTCTTGTTTCTLSGLASGVAYSVTVTATSSLGTSPPSAVVTSTPN